MNKIINFNFADNTMSSSDETALFMLKYGFETSDDSTRYCAFADEVHWFIEGENIFYPFPSETSTEIENGFSLFWVCSLWLFLILCPM